MKWQVLFRHWLMLVVGVVFASATSGGIAYDSGASLMVAALLLSVINLFLKPLLLLLSLPLIVLTLGIGLWILNALLFQLAAFLVEGFYVAGFGSALWGALVLSLTQIVATALFGDPSARQRRGVRVEMQRGGPSAGPHRRARRSELDDGDVIDIDVSED